jgi:hypothetical protein
MAARTFTATTDNLWSNAANWGGNVPASGDTATIPAGQVCEFDVNQMAFAAGLAGLAIAGELRASTTPGVYVLKMAGNITGAGILRAGTAETAYPTTCVFVILLNGNYKINLTGNGSLQLYCLEPATRMVALSAAEDIGQTELSVDTDVTGDIWEVGDLVRVDDVDGDEDSQEHEIAGIAASTITVTAGLKAAKKIGAKVILVSRNVKIVGNGAKKTDRGIEAPTGGVSRCELCGCTNGVYFGYGHTISGTVSGCTNGVTLGSGHTISGTVSGCAYGVYFGSGHTISGTVSGCDYGVYQGSGHTISGTVSGCAWGVNGGSGHTISGTVSGCAYGVTLGSGHTISGTVSGCDYGVTLGSGHTINGTIGVNSSADIYQTPEFRAFGARFLSTVEFSGYADNARLAHHYAESINHDDVTGAYRAWCRGGVVNSVASPVPVGHDIAYQHVCESSSYPVFRRWSLQVQPGARLRVVGWLRKDVSMTYRPRLQIIGQDADTLFDPANEPLAEQVMTDSVNTWEELTLEWTNTAATPRDVWIRSLAMAATGNVYSAVDWDAVDVDGVLADIEAILGRVDVKTSTRAAATNLATLASDVGTIGNDVTDIRSNVDAKITSRASATDLAAVASDVDAIGTDVTTVLGNVSVPTSQLATASDLAAVASDVDDLETRLTATRAGYLDNLSAGAVATATAVADLPTNAELDAALAAADDAVLAAIAALNDISTVEAQAAAAAALTAYSAAKAGDAMTLATDAVSAAALKADAVTEIQSGLSTLAAADVRTAIGLATANLDAQLAALPTASENADALLIRDWTAITGTVADRSTLNALRFLRNKWSISGTTLTVTEEDDTTAAWTGAVTTTSSTDGITALDPA